MKNTIKIIAAYVAGLATLVAFVVGPIDNCHAEERNSALSLQDDIGAKLKLVDFLIKEGAAAGELQKRVPRGNFDQAKMLLEKAWNLAVVGKLSKSNARLFNQLAAQYLVFFVRTTTDYDRINKTVLKEYNDTLPKDPIVLYLLGLSCFRKTQLYQTDLKFEKAMDYLNASIATGIELPEAHWLRAQIYASRRNQIEKVREEHAAVKRLSSKISPALYLYDMDVIRVIIDASSDQ